MLSRKALVFAVTLLVVVGWLVGAGGCRGDYNVVVGSGSLTTQELEFADFTKLEISHVFHVRVTRSDSFSVSITVDDNVLEYVTVRRSGDTLLVYLESGCTYIRTTKIIEITMPRLDRVSLSGASQGEISGFRSSNPLELEASGASSFDIDDVKAGDATFEVSGASYVLGDIEIAEGVFNVSGASAVDLEGYAGDVSIVASGASRVDLADFSVSSATVSVSGASVATVNASDNIDGNVSGASVLTYIGNPALDINKSGDSTVNQR
jgi:hypothetical protein